MDQCGRILAAFFAALLIGTPALPAEDEESMLMLVGYVARELEANEFGCSEELQSAWPQLDMYCFVYGHDWNTFKADWDNVMRHHSLPAEAQAKTEWTLNGGRFRKDIEVRDEELIVVFDERNGLLLFALPATEDDPSSVVAARRSLNPDPAAKPRIAGFGGITIPRLIPESRVEPRHPELARIDQVEGMVVLRVLIPIDGAIARTELLSVAPEGYGFEDAALAAVKDWRYAPALENGEPVDSIFTVLVEFPFPPPGEEVEIVQEEGDEAGETPEVAMEPVAEPQPETETDTEPEPDAEPSEEDDDEPDGGQGSRNRPDPGS